MGWGWTLDPRFFSRGGGVGMVEGVKLRRWRAKGGLEGWNSSWSVLVVEGRQRVKGWSGGAWGAAPVNAVEDRMVGHCRGIQKDKKVLS